MSKLRELRTAHDFSMKRLGELAGTTAQTVERLEKGKMKLTKEWAERLAPHLGVTAQALVFDEASYQEGEVSAERDKNWSASIAKADVRGSVCAGLWFESNDLLQAGFEQVPYVPTKFNDLEQFAFQFSGVSMDLENIRHGDYVVCVPFGDARSAPVSGDLVVIERRNGKLVERTVRKTTLDGDSVAFWPQSTDARFKDPVILPKVGDRLAADGLQVNIVGLVIGVFSPR